ncbi:MAG: hypothetical protein SFU86_10280 [Pirellulaceae bacterium]|nr:hypothetical protein [Pirellulaceae bacterium]
MLAGCEPAEQITQYTADKPTLVSATPPTAAQPQQTLGAILLVDKTGWFFKLVGPPDEVEAQREAFQGFIKSLTFAGTPAPEPTWKLPEGWTEKPGGELRFATIVIPSGEKPLEISVIPLPRGDDDGAYLLENVNRWRGQVSLPPINKAELARTTETIKVGDYDCTFVSLVGTSGGGGGMSGAPFAPFAKGPPSGPAAGPPASGPAGGPAPAAVPESDELTFEIPAGWTAGQQNQFSKLAFNVSDGEKSLVITVSQLGPAAGDVLQNINRWRGQVGLAPTTIAELTPTLQSVATLGVTGQMVTLAAPPEASPRKALLGVIAAAPDGVWFVKLIGDHDLALREKDHFEAFVKSLKMK